MTHGHRPPPREYSREWQHGPYQKAEPAPQRNGIATAGFVVALIGAVLSLIPFVGTVSWVISPVGLILSAVGLFLAFRRGAGKGLAIAGVLLGIFGLVMCVIYTNSFVNAVNETSTPGTAAPARSAPAPATASPYGTALTADDLTVTAAAPKRVNSPLGSQSCATVTYRNTGTAQASFNPFDWKFRTPDGVEASASIPYGTKSALNSGELAPGGTVSGQVCADNTIKKVSAVVYSPGFAEELVWQ